MTIDNLIEKSWSTITCSWPRDGLVANNPLDGLKDLPFEEALIKSEAYFQQKTLPSPMQDVNRITIKWLQVFFGSDNDESLGMPLRFDGFFKALCGLLVFDNTMRWTKEKKHLFQKLVNTPHETIERVLETLKIPQESRALFATLMLTTLPGWTAHVLYCTTKGLRRSDDNIPITKEGYLAVRLLLTALLWPEARELLKWYEQGVQHTHAHNLVNVLEEQEFAYRQPLLQELKTQSEMLHSSPHTSRPAKAQVIFCIDARCEFVRRALETDEGYETFSLAGFFGVPIRIQNNETHTRYASCPGILDPLHNVFEAPQHSGDVDTKIHRLRECWQNREFWKELYIDIKRRALPLFLFSNALGFLTGLWMGMKTFLPSFSFVLKRTLTSLQHPRGALKTFTHTIPLEEQCTYASYVLRLIGLVDHFAPLIVFCGHRSSAQNNTHASLFYCGACAGRRGGPNASVIVNILNNPEVRERLQKDGIFIPEETHFLSAEHDTANGALHLDSAGSPNAKKRAIERLRIDLEHASGHIQHKQSKRWSRDWAQARPEWGLAGNASLIIAPRLLTKSMVLQGRSFLHSYDWKTDDDGSALALILGGSLAVAQSINAHYLFGTLNNVAFGGGDTLTQSVMSDIGVMQGNGSDLMYGLPFRLFCAQNTTPLYQPLRFMSVIYAPRTKILPLIKGNDTLSTFLANEWTTLACLDPETRASYVLQKDFTWRIAC